MRTAPVVCYLRQYIMWFVTLILTVQTYFYSSLQTFYSKINKVSKYNFLFLNTLYLFECASEARKFCLNNFGPRQKLALEASFEQYTSKILWKSKISKDYRNRGWNFRTSIRIQHLQVTIVYQWRLVAF